MAQVDIVGRLRRHQATMVKDEEIQEKYADIMKTLYVRRSGSICPPWPEMVNSISSLYLHPPSIVSPPDAICLIGGSGG